MKVLLVSANLCREPYPVYPLGMSVIAGALTAAGHEVLQYDPLVHGLDMLHEAVRKFSPGAIGVSIRNLDTVNSRSAGKPLLETPVHLVKMIRSLTNAPVILGGSGFSLLPMEILEMTGADYGIAGEGERAMCALIHDLEAGRNDIPVLMHGLPGVQAAPLYQKDLFAFYISETHILPVQTKRGCPFGCVYCTYPALEGHSIRIRETASILRDLKRLAEDRELLFYFVDSVFNDPKGEFRKFLDELKKTEIRDMAYCGFISPSGFTKEDALLLKSSGMIAAELGIDAASDTTLHALGKDFTFRQAQEACRLLLDQKIGVTTNIMFGGPGETPETVRAGIRNLYTLTPALTMIFSGIRIFPNTPLYKLAQKRNMIPRGWNGLESLYYFEPGIDPEKLHRTLCSEFMNSTDFIYPPDQKNTELQMIHRYGYRKLRRLRNL